MIKLESLKKSEHFKLVLKGKRNHTDYFSMFATKNFFNIQKKNLVISFVTKKKIGNSVKRNRIRRRVKIFIAGPIPDTLNCPTYALIVIKVF